MADLDRIGEPGCAAVFRLFRMPVQLGRRDFVVDPAHPLIFWVALRMTFDDQLLAFEATTQGNDQAVGGAIPGIAVAIDAGIVEAQSAAPFARSLGWATLRAWRANPGIDH